MNKNNKEIEVRFLEIDKPALINKLLRAGAKDLGEDLLAEIIFYDKEFTWRDEQKFVRLRKTRDKVLLTYKHHFEDSAEGTEEIELEVSDLEKAAAILEKTNLMAYRWQEKYRHTFTLDGVTVDIDTWPKIPTYVELEGHSEESLKTVAANLGLDWRTVTFENARKVIENKYKIPVGKMRWFTFDRFE
jgi:adenylate cyclase class 2